MAGGRGRWICKLGRAGGSGPRPQAGATGRRRLILRPAGESEAPARGRGGVPGGGRGSGRPAFGAVKGLVTLFPRGSGRPPVEADPARWRNASISPRGCQISPDTESTGRACLGGRPSRLPTGRQARPVRLGARAVLGLAVRCARGNGLGHGKARRGIRVVPWKRPGASARPPCPACDLSWSAGNSCSAHSRHSARSHRNSHSRPA